MPNKNNKGYQDQQNREANIQAKSGQQRGQSNNQSNKKNANTTATGNPINKSGRSDSDNQE